VSPQTAHAASTAPLEPPTAASDAANADDPPFKKTACPEGGSLITERCRLFERVVFDEIDFLRAGIWHCNHHVELLLQVAAPRFWPRRFISFRCQTATPARAGEREVVHFQVKIILPWPRLTQ
jgi:hypothetical protein